MSYHIGLLMINGEDDILERTLEHNTQFVDAFYVLDGTVDNTVSEAVCRAHPKCWAYRRDADLPRPPYTERTLCGYRQFIYQLAVMDHGPNNWFLVLHADEMWPDPRNETRGASHDGFVYRLPFFFPREWDDDRHPLDQLHWSLWPGWPEFRLFKGGPGVAYDPVQEFNTRPAGLSSVGYAADAILHYPYRSPWVQRDRALLHQRTQFDPDNYQHIIHGDQVIWTDEMIAAYQQKPEFRNLRGEVPAGSLAGRV